MFFTRWEKQADFATLTASGLHTTLIKTKKNVHAVALLFGASGTLATQDQICGISTRANAQVDTVRIRMKGETKIEAPANVLAKLNDYYYPKTDVFTPAAGALIIPFTRPIHPVAAERHALVWGMKDTEGFVVELQMFGTITNCTKCEVWLEIDDLEPRPLGDHITIRPYQFSSADPQQITTLPLGDRSRGVGRLALHIDSYSATTTGVINTVTDRVDGQNIYDNVPLSLNQWLLRKSGRFQQADMFHVDYARANSILGYLPMDNVASYIQTIDWTTLPNSGSFRVYVEQIEGINTPGK